MKENVEKSTYIYIYKTEKKELAQISQYPGNPKTCEQSQPRSAKQSS